MDQKPSAVHKPYLPEDLVFKEILPRLPVQSLGRFKSVSKAWLAHIAGDNPTFLADHIAHSSAKSLSTIVCGRKKATSVLFLLGDDYHSKLVEFDTSYMFDRDPSKARVFIIIGSCNGLLCLRIDYLDRLDRGSLVLWNPATKEFRFFPILKLPRARVRVSYALKVRFDFGFDERGNEYKLVEVDEIRVKEDEGLIRVLISVRVLAKSDGFWRERESFEGLELFSDSTTGLKLNGALLWPAMRKGSGARRLVVMSFDLHGEKVREIEGPVILRNNDDNEDNIDDYNFVLMKRKGCLGAFTLRTKMGCEFWLRTESDDMKSNNGGFGWTKMFSVGNLAHDPESYFFWMFIARIRDWLLCINERRRGFLYDPISQEMRDFDEELGLVYSGADYFPTLVSPH